jgi:hypothetical protein
MQVIHDVCLEEFVIQLTKPEEEENNPGRLR